MSKSYKGRERNGAMFTYMHIILNYLDFNYNSFYNYNVFSMKIAHSKSYNTLLVATFDRADELKIRVFGV